MGNEQAPEGHRAVTEGTVLVLEASRLPLGRVEEVFGQVTDLRMPCVTSMCPRHTCQSIQGIPPVERSNVG